MKALKNNKLRSFDTVCHTQHICSCYTCKCGDAVCTAVFGKDGYSGAKLKII